jgi:hypothetical protein
MAQDSLVFLPAFSFSCMLLNRLLLLFNCGLSLALLALVLLAPQLVQDDPIEQPDLLLLFAFDPTIRRATLACAAALVVTAMVFFRPSGDHANSPTTTRKKNPHSNSSIGA